MAIVPLSPIQIRSSLSVVLDGFLRLTLQEYLLRRDSFSKALLLLGRSTILAACKRRHALQAPR
jgi:hypothetical protein